MSDLVELRRQLAEVVLSRLASEISGISAHLGEDYENSSVPEAVEYRRIGGKFRWLAFAFAPWRMWDLHVGVVETGQGALSLGFHISERAAPVLRSDLEKCASELATTVIHQQLAVEYQANLPPQSGTDANVDALADRVVSLCKRFAPVAARVACPADP